MEAFIIKGIETSWLAKLLYNSNFLIPLILISGLSILFIDITLYLLVFLTTLCTLQFLLSFFRIEISDTKINVEKYLLGVCIGREVFDRQNNEEFIERNEIFEFEIISKNYKIRIYRHVPSFNSEDEPWISISTDSKNVCIRTISEKKSIECLNQIKNAIKQTVK